jgi:hypothetical protein
MFPRAGHGHVAVAPYFTAEGIAMNGHLRPSPVVIRTWFLILGFAIVACLVSLFDVSIQPLTPAPGDAARPAFSDWTR